MDLKFYLNKFLKADNIEYYTLSTLLTLKDSYTKFIEASNGSDPDFPMANFGGGNKNGDTISVKKGNNVYDQFENEEDIPEDFKGISGNIL